MDPYEVLGLTASASNEELEARYRVLLRRHHPDMHQGEGPQGVAQAEYATRLLNQAMTQIRRERDATTSSAAAGSARPRAERGPDPGPAGPTGPGAPGSGPDNRAHARPRSPSPDADPAAAAAAAGPAGPWWAGPQKAGSPCPFCGVHLADYDSYERHLQEAHRVRIETPRRRGFSLSISRGVGDALRVLAMLVSAVVVLWLSQRVQLSAVIWFVVWLGSVALFLPTLLLRPRNRRR